jgi:membrane protein
MMRMLTGKLRSALQIGRRALRESLADRITMISASLAFHWFLAIFPAAVALIGLCGLVGLSPATLHSLTHGITTIMPSQTSGVITSALHSTPGKGASRLAVIVGTLIAIWSATEAMAALQIGLDVAFEVTKDRGFFGRRLMGLPLLLLTLVLGASASVLLVLGNPIRQLLPKHSALVGSTANAAWDTLRFAGAFVLVMLLLSAYYSVAPRRPRFKWRWVSAGSVVATLGWLIASGGFSLYLDHFGHVTKSYGAFADVAVLLLWLYVTGVMVLIGAEINCEMERGAPAGTAEPLASLPVDAPDDLA